MQQHGTDFIKTRIHWFLNLLSKTTVEIMPPLQEGTPVVAMKFVLVIVPVRIVY